MQRTLSIHEEHSFLSRLEEAGLTSELVQMILESRDNKLAQEVIRFIWSGGFETPNTYQAYRDILGDDFITPEEVSGVIYKNDQLWDLRKNLPSLEVVKWCQENKYILIPGPPTKRSLYDVTDTFKYLFADHYFGGYNGDDVKNGWILLGKYPVADSLSKTWAEQRQLLRGNEVVPSTTEVAWCMAVYQTVRKICLFHNISVRTSSGQDKYLEVIGHHKSQKIDIESYWDGRKHRKIGLASSLKL